jgi:hypothetical protein
MPVWKAWRKLLLLLYNRCVRADLQDHDGEAGGELAKATSPSTSARIPLQPYLGGKVPGLLSMLSGGVVIREYLVH